MTTKKKIVILLIIFSVFAIIFGIIIHKQNLKYVDLDDTMSEDDVMKHNYANNSTTEDITSEENIDSTDSEGPDLTSIVLDENGTYVIGDISYEHYNLLTEEQQNQSDDFSSIITNFARDKGKEVQTVNILDDTNKDSSNVFLQISYKDNSIEDLVVMYDATYKHRYMRISDRETYESIERGDLAGDGEIAPE